MLVAINHADYVRITMKVVDQIKKFIDGDTEETSVEAERIAESFLELFENIDLSPIVYEPDNSSEEDWYSDEEEPEEEPEKEES